MSELSAAAAAALGVPEAIVERSAAARAAETGMSVDEVLSVWAGGGDLPVAAAVEAPTEPSEDSPEAPPAEQEETASPAPTGSVPAAAPAAPAAAARPGAVTRAPVPPEVTAAEAATLPEVITVPTAGIRERTNFTIPRWLAAVMLIIPAFALFALGSSATGECGDGTELATDVITGDIVNCDGTEFTGSGAGGGGADFIAMGEAIYNAAPGNCQSCHGANGGGAGAIPALTGVLTTFGACDDHVRWVELGSPGFQAAGESTYGDTNKPINGGMPSFGSSLSAEQLAAVTAFERVRFGGADPAQTLVDCGLAEGEDEEGEDGESPVPGEEAPADGATSTTMGAAEAAVGRTP
ncbi:MAG TPA: c-type cytochrome [Acidimicrobiia bacterium]|nr:c-type cytochrome [Acidimicrobiia bacterium]